MCDPFVIPQTPLAWAIIMLDDKTPELDDVVGLSYCYPLVIYQFAMENGHRNSEFSHEKLVIFHSYVNVYQAG